jgi:L-histidine N-alpha-methyltransferase
VAIVHLPARDPADTLAEAVRRGLTDEPKWLPCRFFYDEEGSRLFEAICELPEYYLTRTEDSILRRHARAMVSGRPAPPVLVELGSGSSMKTRRLIAAALGEYGALHYVPIDVSAAMLEQSAGRLVREFPGLDVTAYAADYHEALAHLDGSLPGPKIIAFLGSSLGNYEPADAARLLRDVGRIMGPEDRLLLGTDLIKERATLDAAYDDSEGVTARFNRNLLVRINRELGADFDPEAFDHRARYRPERERVEIHLVSARDQVVRIPGASLSVRFSAGEAIHTENSHKYDLAGLAATAARSGFDEEAAWTDPEGRFRIQLWRRRDG